MQCSPFSKSHWSELQSQAPSPVPTSLPRTHGQEMQGSRETGLDSQGSSHVDLSQRGHRQGIPCTLCQVHGAQRQAGGSEVSTCVLPWKTGRA